MERKLLEASLTGDVQNLHQLLRDNPLILHTVSLASSGNPLHVASAHGHIDFVKEITRLRPDFAKELNEDGFSPMHMASANGYLEIVRELMKVDRKLCRLQGRENKTPLHLAVIKGRVDVVSEILSACGECLEDVTVQRDTAMHLSIKNYQFEVIRVMVDWIREMKKEHVLNMKDEHDNTALHLATWKKQRQASSLSYLPQFSGLHLHLLLSDNHNGNFDFRLLRPYKENCPLNILFCLLPFIYNNLTGSCR
ncbi:hypothetical protein LWI29_036179 [Acer saccharum]|uniref:Ankyrin repeat-containing protein BDA1-like n=1 Tax=Acer saccharum TaxID=4024 RepID=A0AA39SEB5_ACESA|nr:hypothetical protein LWI29_036179 [Acer saccharum]